MKKIILTLIACVALADVTSAQVLPSFQFGVKAGVNTSSLSNGAAFNVRNDAGYLAGFWARFGALGFNFQPEVYFNDKQVGISGNGIASGTSFNSIDVPLLFGTKIGAFGFGARFYTGPVISFPIDKEQTFGTAASKAFEFDYHNQKYAWQIGTGIDIRKISLDVRYEAGLSGQNYGPNNTKINLFQFSLGYKLF